MPATLPAVGSVPSPGMPGLSETSVGLKEPRFANWGSVTHEVVQALIDMPQNWDGEGGLTPTQATINQCCVFLKSIRESLAQLQKEIEEPFVTATPEGGVLLHWHIDESHALEVEFANGPKGVAIKYGMFNAQTQDSVEGEIRKGRNQARVPYPLSILLFGPATAESPIPQTQFSLGN